MFPSVFGLIEQTSLRPRFFLQGYIYDRCTGMADYMLDAESIPRTKQYYSHTPSVHTITKVTAEVLGV